jgi:hypothetical protein
MAQPEMGTPEVFRGQASDVCYSTSPWFNCEEIPADSWGGYVVQIEEVRARRGVKFNKGKAKERELFLKFAGIEKELRVGVTIRRVLDEMISPMCGEWFGKRITLFVQGGIDTSEGKKNGVRVRPNLPPQVAPKQDAPKPSAPPPGAKFRADVLGALVEFKATASPAELDALKIAAGVVDKTNAAQFTPEDIARINAALPGPFRVAT